MDNIKLTHTVPVLILVGVLVLIGLVIFLAKPGQSEAPQQTATSTDVSGIEGEQTADVPEDSDGTEDSAEEQTSTEPSSPQPPLSVGLQTPTPEMPIPLGPRQKADSPASALKFFAEAMRARDYERAASYIREDIRPGYLFTFEEKDLGGRYPHVFAYYEGTVDKVQLVEPESGLYEIALYPAGSTLAFRPRFMYDTSANEFVFVGL